MVYELVVLFTCNILYYILDNSFNTDGNFFCTTIISCDKCVVVVDTVFVLDSFSFYTNFYFNSGGFKRTKINRIL